MSRLLSGRLSAVVLSTVLIGALSSIAAKADDCSNEKALKSLPSSAASELSFQNASAEKRRIYWIDHEGDRKFYGVVEPGNAFKQPTFAGHAWVVTDELEKCLFSFVASAEPRVVDVGGAVANVVPPPPGGQQPIVQAPPQVVVPPVVVQTAPPPAQTAPPPVQVAPPPVAAQLPPTAPPAADPTTLVDPQLTDVPQVSPVEQFQLNGAYRLVTRLDNTKVLNNEASGTLDVMAVQPEWDSAQWVFEAVPGTPFVRIRNLWKKTYLTDVNGKPRAVPATSEATESHWTFEPVDGTSFVQFRNRETDRFLLSVNGAAVLVDDFRQDMESNSHWRNAPVSGGAVSAAVNPPRPLYDDALASCRGIGGYWTGSSCRRPVYLTEPLVCPRGFVWAEEAGECIWDGGRCPPWQVGPGGVCGANLACRGGAVAPGPRGFPACYCPPGAVAWGNYPNLTCVPSVARIAPLLIGGVALGILGSGQGRPVVGQVFGNKKFCPPGQIGTPPNCTVATSCVPPLVGTPPNCTRIVQGNGGCPAGTTPQVGGNILRCISQATGGGTPQPQPTPVVNPTGGAGGTGAGGTTTPICQLGQRLDAATNKCVSINTVTCTGGTVAQGVCGCPAGTTLQGGGTNFQCVTGTGAGGGTPSGSPTTTPVVTTCPSGTTGTPPNCVPVKVVRDPTVTNPQIGPAVTTTVDPATGIQTTKTTGPTGAVTTQQTCAPGFTGTPPNCKSTAGGGPTNTSRACNVGEVPQAAGCQCKDPLFIFDGKCAQQTLAKPLPIPTRACTVGEVPQTANCLCKDPLFIFDGKCAQQTLAKPLPIPTRACSVGEVPQTANCLCKDPLFIFDGKCAQQTLAKPLPIPTRACSVGEVPQTANCLCKDPLFIFDGKCAQQTLAKPTTPTSRACNAGENPQTANCQCKGPLQIGANGNCSPPSNIRLAPATCPTGQVGTPPDCKPAPPATCPSGQIGTPPNCRPAPPATCPSGQIGTPPNCRPAPPATCPSGQIGTPPNCRPAPPATCPSGQIGTPPNCRPAPPATCPSGQIGTPPNCRPAPPATCPSGQIGTPPNCRPAPPATCPSGQIGTPPNCRVPPPPPPPPPKPVLQQPAPTGCAPPKKLNPAGQCV